MIMNNTSRLLLVILFSLIIFNVTVIRSVFKFIPTDIAASLGQYAIAPIPIHSVESAATPTQTDTPLPLPQLVQSSTAAETPCPNGTSPILDTTIQQNDDNSPRKIPKIIHITSKTRCATPAVHTILNKWRFPNHSLYFHDDEAISRLTSHSSSQQSFPLLNETLKCVTNGATKSDLWRYLVLHTYGGVYTDIDNAPREFNEDTISSEHDSFFVIESLGIISQYFIASSPGHPLMELSLNYGLKALRGTVNVMRNNPARTTGPAALKHGFITFMNDTSTGYIEAGTFVGINNRSVTAIGTKNNPKQYIDRGGLGESSKREYYKGLGIEHFHDNKLHPNQGRISCMDHLGRTIGTDRVANYRFNGSVYVDLG